MIISPQFAGTSANPTKNPPQIACSGLRYGLTSLPLRHFVFVASGDGPAGVSQRNRVVSFSHFPDLLDEQKTGGDPVFLHVAERIFGDQLEQLSGGAPFAVR